MLGAWASQLCGWHDLNAIMQQLGLVSVFYVYSNWVIGIAHGYIMEVNNYM